MLELTINKEKYQFHFGMKLIFDLGKKWGLNSFADVVTKIQNELLLNLDETIPLNAIGTFMDMLEIQQPYKYEECLNHLFVNPDDFKKYMEAFLESMPRPKNEVIPESINANAKKKVQRTK